jgi:hypothetical protein
LLALLIGDFGEGVLDEGTFWRLGKFSELIDMITGEERDGCSEEIVVAEKKDHYRNICHIDIRHLWEG